MVCLQLSNLFQKEEKGPGYWHCNVTVLNDEILKIEVEALWKVLNNDFEKDLAWWEKCKLECKHLNPLAPLHYSRIIC